MQQFKISTKSYKDQIESWPESGRHILAHHDDETIVVYQAYKPAIGHFAAEHGYFGGGFKYSRMSWIKPNFLWMMYRSDWGRSEGQEVILAIRLRRAFFDSLLQQTVPSTYSPEVFANHDEWKTGVRDSDVRLQWDPDHFPNGDKCGRRAVQLGLRGETLEAYGKREAIKIIDISEFVTEQRQNIQAWRTGDLVTPIEQVYQPFDHQIAEHINLESSQSS